MEHLRSSVVHHLGLEPMALRDYARRGKKVPRNLFKGNFQKPSYQLFQSHCAHVIESTGVLRCFMRGKAEKIRKIDTGYSVETGEGTLRAKHLIVAIGLGDQLRLPEWARCSGETPLPVNHLFDPSFRLADCQPGQASMIIGGGISAVQVAIELAKSPGRQIQIVARHLPRQSEFDSDSCFMGPKCLNGFWGDRSPVGRRRRITEARRPGSIPPELAGKLKRLEKTGQIMWVRGEVASVNNADCTVHLADGSFHSASSVLLATGFDQQRPGGKLISDLITDQNLRVAPCGYPVLMPDLQWGKKLFVSGPLAELELGPVSRNILGARLAAERITLQG